MIDPVEFGKLETTVDAMGKDVAELKRDMREMLALANRGRGAFWMGMTLAGFVGAAVHWATGLFHK